MCFLTLQKTSWVQLPKQELQFNYKKDDQFIEKGNLRTVAALA